MVKEAEENKEADQKRKDDIEVKNKAQTYVDEINQTLTEKGDKTGRYSEAAVDRPSGRSQRRHPAKRHQQASRNRRQT
jgi:molecular chaperone DnaK (HSP70)